MPQEKYTRCPGCRTIFRVTSAQLAVRAGQVRCGQCKTVFDGNAQLISLAPSPRVEPDAGYDAVALGPPTVTLRNAHALEDPARDEARRESVAAEPQKEPAHTAAVAEVAYDDRFAWDRKRARPGLATLYLVAVPVLVVLFMGQVLFHFRDALAARWPGSNQRFGHQS